MGLLSGAMKRGVMIGAAVVVMAAVYITGRIGGRKAAEQRVEIQTDTIVVHDTSVVIQPKIRQRTRIDTIWVKADTVRVRDTLYVAMERERVVADSSGLYRVSVSGVAISIDTIQVYPQREIVTRTLRERESRWAVSVQAGVGLSTQGAVPYVGIGVSYELWRPKKW